MYNSDCIAAKILLIGEYTVLYGSKAVAFPWEKNYAQWKQQDTVPIYDISSFFSYLSSNSIINKAMNVDELGNDISSHWQFVSNIPLGYGLGSSACLCAALLKKYQYHMYSISDTMEILVHMENYFHGNSSGIDPMIAYYQKPLLIDNGLHFLDKSYMNHLKNYQIQLYDSMQTRDTKSQVELFKNKMKAIEFQLNIEQNLIPLNNDLIQYFLENQTHLFIEHWKKLSKLSFEIYNEMIPAHVKIDWQNAWRENKYMKLCGAGGGGYFLVLEE